MGRTASSYLVRTVRSVLLNLLLVGGLIVIASGNSEYVPDEVWEMCVDLPKHCPEVRIPEGYGNTKPNPNDSIPNR